MRLDLTFHQTIHKRITQSHITQAQVFNRLFSIKRIASSHSEHDLLGAMNQQKLFIYFTRAASCKLFAFQVCQLHALLYRPWNIIEPSLDPQFTRVWQTHYFVDQDYLTKFNHLIASTRFICVTTSESLIESHLQSSFQVCSLSLQHIFFFFLISS